jgi:hypothetical protein
VCPEDTPALELLKILILHPELAEKVFPHWEPDGILHIPLKGVIQTLKQRHATGSETVQAELICLTDDSALCNWIAEVLTSPIYHEPDRAAHDCLVGLKCREKESQIAELLRQLKSAEAGNKDTSSYTLQIVHLKKEIEIIKHQRLWEMKP